MRVHLGPLDHRDRIHILAEVHLMGAVASRFSKRVAALGRPRGSLGPSIRQSLFDRKL